jgi:hypothetical protein
MILSCLGFALCQLIPTDLGYLFFAIAMILNFIMGIGGTIL